MWTERGSGTSPVRFTADALGWAWFQGRCGRPAALGRLRNSKIQESDKDKLGDAELHLCGQQGVMPSIYSRYKQRGRQSRLYWRVLSTYISRVSFDARSWKTLQPNQQRLQLQSKTCLTIAPIANRLLACVLHLSLILYSTVLGVSAASAQCGNVWSSVFAGRRLGLQRSKINGTVNAVRESAIVRGQR
jgi:hypothetical protein